jgi:hypothetical protein
LFSFSNLQFIFFSIKACCPRNQAAPVEALGEEGAGVCEREGAGKSYVDAGRAGIFGAPVIYKQLTINLRRICKKRTADERR